jgi:gamma-glutamyl-gamma-aminobutyraldehyde dehydrogenase
MSAAFWNQSENCSCGSRLIVQKNVKATLLEKLVAAAKSLDWTVGNPQLLTSSCGAMISPQHCEKVLGYIAKGIEEGAELVCGGKRCSTVDDSGGDFVELTIFSNVDNSMAIAQEEIFGPVLCVIEFDTEEEGISIANDTKYGLAASLYTDNIHRATRVARRLKAGNVSVNCFGEGDASTPFGGYKQSGFGGRDKGLHAHEQYQEIKTIWQAIHH